MHKLRVVLFFLVLILFLFFLEWPALIFIALLSLGISDMHLVRLLYFRRIWHSTLT